MQQVQALQQQLQQQMQQQNQVLQLDKLTSLLTQVPPPTVSPSLFPPYLGRSVPKRKDDAKKLLKPVDTNLPDFQTVSSSFRSSPLVDLPVDQNFSASLQKRFSELMHLTKEKVPG